MRKTILTSIMTLVVAAAYALPIECVGTAKQVENGNDTLFFFADEIHMKSKIGEVDWYATDGTSVATAVDEIYPDEGGYYVVDTAGVQSSPFYVFRYSAPSNLEITIEPDCDYTTLVLSGNYEPFTYTRPNGTTGSYARTYLISYNALAWDTEAWVDSAAQASGTFNSTIVLPPLYGPTPIRLYYDPDIHDGLQMDSAFIETELALEDVKAVNMMLTSLATTRGKEGEKSNERNRPTSQDIIKASVDKDYSGPLEVAFYSNPTPAVLYYKWQIFKSAERIVTRNDQDIRYTFSEPGSYRVVCSVNNQYCKTDSMEMFVAISESYLAVPNVFTPDGNGQNDEFRVAYRSLREFHCWVYNRWGKLVYEWTDPAKGWDGTINGRPAAEGAYYYVIRALGTDAAKNARYMGKAIYNKKKQKVDEAVIGVYQMSGDINLIRGKK
ncbi:MAG: gliding motility-associated C-terminal domain-containing protein [Paludibacteraceae bacterium]|nr:gliding motility-associated C-terminal domain-containing protein [Paludibacteraceae bacterium]